MGNLPWLQPVHQRDQQDASVGATQLGETLAHQLLPLTGLEFLGGIRA